MQLTLHATRQTPHGAARLDASNVCLVGEPNHKRNQKNVLKAPKTKNKKQKNTKIRKIEKLRETNVDFWGGKSDKNDPESSLR